VKFEINQRVIFNVYVGQRVVAHHCIITGCWPPGTLVSWYPDDEIYHQGSWYAIEYTDRVYYLVREEQLTEDTS